MPIAVDHRPGAALGWTVQQPSRDPCRRLQIHGPILPMEQPGLLARLFRRH